ncbi:MAG: response regulator [Euryarchaeota archaeon]|nr:response regulator [Euryarchaeota archaeon]
MAKIMIVDDDEGILESAASILKSEGFEVITTRGGEECLEKLREIRPDCIILDTGYNAYRQTCFHRNSQGEINKRLCRLLDEAVHERGNHKKPASNWNFLPQLEEN